MQKRPLWPWLARFMLGGILVAVLIARHGDEFGRALKAVPLPVLLLSVGLYGAGQVLSAWKWRGLLRALKANVSLRECCRLYWLGMFANLWLPTSVGGDALRVLLLRREHALGAGGATTSVVLERGTGLLALLLIGAFALLFDAGSNAGTGRASRVFALFALLAGVGVVLMLAFLRAGRRLPQKLGTLRDAMRRFASREGRRALGVAMLWSLVFQGSQIAINIFLARAIGLPVSALSLAWIAPALALASLLPVGVGGLGVRETAAVALMSGLPSSGVSPGQVVAWSLLWQATVWLSSLPGGVLMVTARRQSSKV